MSLIKRLAEIAAELESKTMRVGIIETETYQDGTPVAQVGYWNEYGYEGMIPGRKQKIYHSINADGSMRNGGKFVKAKKANFERIVDVPDYELKIPPRPFFRTAIANAKSEMAETIAKSLRNNDVETALRNGGEVLVNELKEQVLTWSDPENAKSTQRKKGFNAPLRGQERLLRNSFTVEISDD